jgi:hypothetical protein
MILTSGLLKAKLASLTFSLSTFGSWYMVGA